MMASSAPGMFLCAANTVKFFRSAAAARLMAIATSGVVVSKPTPTNTISRSGRWAANASASSGEYTICTLRPAACSFSRLEVEPGTRVMSPNVAMVTFGMRARAMTVSMSRFEVTHTGQPGPLAKRVPGGMRLRMPLRAMATVCVPHTSMSVAPPAGASLPMDSMRPRASCGSLNAASSRCISAASTVRASCRGTGAAIEVAVAVSAAVVAAAVPAAAAMSAAAARAAVAPAAAAWAAVPATETE